MSDVVIFGEKHSNCGVLKDSADRVVGFQTDDAEYYYLGEAFDMNGDRWREFLEYPPSAVDRLEDLFSDPSDLDKAQGKEFSRIMTICALAGVSHSNMKISLTYDGAGFSDRVLVEHIKKVERRKELSDRVLVEHIKKVERRKELSDRALEEISNLAGDTKSKLELAAKLGAETQATLGQGIYLSGGAPWIKSMKVEEKMLFNLLIKDNRDREGWCLTLRQIAKELRVSVSTVMRRKRKLEQDYPEAKSYIDEKRCRNHSLADLDAEENLKSHTDGAGGD
jgi:hypothetical protein